MPFGLTNTPIAFMDLMNLVFRLYLSQFIIVFNEDILIYSRSLKEQETHLRIALQTLLLYSEFWLFEVVFLGHMVSLACIFVDQTKVEVVLKLEKPRAASKIWSFLSLGGYYQWFK